MPVKSFAVVVAMIAGTAAAQAAGPEFAGGGPIRVQVTIQRQIPAPAGPEDQSRAMESLRRLIYESADHECAMLSETFKADCRLTNLNVNSSMMERGNLGAIVNSNGNASYELTPRTK